MSGVFPSTILSIFTRRLFLYSDETRFISALALSAVLKNPIWFPLCLFINLPTESSDTDVLYMQGFDAYTYLAPNIFAIVYHLFLGCSSRSIVTEHRDSS